MDNNKHEGTYPWEKHLERNVNKKIIKIRCHLQNYLTWSNIRRLIYLFSNCFISFVILLAVTILSFSSSVLSFNRHDKEVLKFLNASVTYLQELHTVLFSEAKVSAISSRVWLRLSWNRFFTLKKYLFRKNKCLWYRKKKTFGFLIWDSCRFIYLIASWY